MEGLLDSNVKFPYSTGYYVVPFLSHNSHFLIFGAANGPQPIGLLVIHQAEAVMP